MAYPNFSEEKKYWRQGYRQVAGLDEAGRGPLAGPVVAGAIVLNSKSKIQNLKIKDSKQLSEKKREQIYEILINHPDIVWGVGVVSEKVIDSINILQATKLAMKKAIRNLGQQPDMLLIDGNFTISLEIPQASIIKGDQLVFSIAAASIIAKVTRDRLMQALHQQYPDYGFNSHKGYGTASHLKNIKKLGPCNIHRKSFYPLSELSTD